MMMGASFLLSSIFFSLFSFVDTIYLYLPVVSISIFSLLLYCAHPHPHHPSFFKTANNTSASLMPPPSFPLFRLPLARPYRHAVVSGTLSSAQRDRRFLVQTNDGSARPRSVKILYICVVFFSVCIVFVG